MDKSGWVKTKTGRIVYERSKHSWTRADFARVARLFGSGIAGEPGNTADQVYGALVDAQTSLLGSLFAGLGLDGLAAAADQTQAYLQQTVQSLITAAGFDTAPVDQAIADLLNYIGEIYGGKVKQGDGQVRQ